MKKIIPTILVLLLIYFLCSSYWGDLIWAGQRVDQVALSFEWFLALVCSLVILVCIWLEKAHHKVSLVLIGCFVLFLIRAKIFGASGLDDRVYSNKSGIDFYDVTVEFSTEYWIMFVLAIVMFGVHMKETKPENHTYKDWLKVILKRPLIKRPLK